MITGKIKKVNMDRLPLYEMFFNEEGENGIELISILSDPAIEVMGVAFSSQIFFKKDKDKMIIIGPALIPDMKIYRDDELFGPHNVVFSKETIEKLVENLNKNGDNRKINIDHENRMVDGFIMEDWIIEDGTFDKSKKYGFNLPVGTYMIKVKIDDEDFWNTEVKENGKYGFSIQGKIDQRLLEFEKIDNEIEEIDINDLDESDLLDIFDIQ